MARKTTIPPVTPLVVSPKQAQALLGARITLDSINRHIAKRLAEGGGRKGVCNTNKQAKPRVATTQSEPTTTQETAA